MSIIIFVNKKLKATGDWDRAIAEAGFHLEITSAIPVSVMDGNVSFQLGDQSGQFYFSQNDIPSDELGEECKEIAAEFKHAFRFTWENQYEQANALIAAVGYCDAVGGGRIWLVQEKRLIARTELVEWLTGHDAQLTKRAGDRYKHDARPLTKITDNSAENIQHLRKSEYGVLIGRNNSGKSFVLKSLAQHWGKSASYLGPARYQNFNVLGYFTPNKNKKDQKFSEFSQWLRNTQNLDNSPINLQQEIAELTNIQRDALASIAKSLLNVELQILNTVSDNDMSQKYVSVDGHNLSYTSSGLRLIITLVTCLLNQDYDTVLIDEPELGISPEAQGILADFLLDMEMRKQHFAHIKSIIVATHSTIFLDRRNQSNNYRVEKEKSEISIQRVISQSDFNKIHFQLLGNRFETLYLPSAMIIVEGKTDHKFFQRLLTLKYPDSRLSIVAANSDDQVKKTLHMAKGLLNDLQRSPYRDRIFAVLDSVHGKSLPADLVKMGLPAENVIVWPQNGIEYYYPKEIIDQIFGAGSTLTINDDDVSRNGITILKNDLADKVVAAINAQSTVHPDLTRLFLSKLEALIR